mgnify:CR=1 FL=1
MNAEKYRLEIKKFLSNMGFTEEPLSFIQFNTKDIRK